MPFSNHKQSGSHCLNIFLIWAIVLYVTTLLFLPPCSPCVCTPSPQCPVTSLHRQPATLSGLHPPMLGHLTWGHPLHAAEILTHCVTLPCPPQIPSSFHLGSDSPVGPILCVATLVTLLGLWHPMSGHLSLHWSQSTEALISTVVPPAPFFRSRCQPCSAFT